MHKEPFEKTYPCKYHQHDKQYVRVGYAGVLFRHDVADTMPTTVVLTLEQAIEIGKVAAEFKDKRDAAIAQPEAPKPKGYNSLSPLAKTVVQHMRRAGSISAREAMADHNITSASLSRRICDIEQAGFEIKRQKRIHPIFLKQYTRYSIEKEPTHA